MTISEIENHYATIVRAVFIAESNTKPTLRERMEAAIEKKGGSLNDEESDKLVDEYLHDIARLMIRSTPVEELKKIYG